MLCFIKREKEGKQKPGRTVAVKGEGERGKSAHFVSHATKEGKRGGKKGKKRERGGRTKRSPSSRSFYPAAPTEEGGKGRGHRPR